jgi:hypothetical protein
MRNFSLDPNFSASELIGLVKDLKAKNNCLFILLIVFSSILFAALVGFIAFKIATKMHYDELDLYDDFYDEFDDFEDDDDDYMVAGDGDFVKE